MASVETESMHFLWGFCGTRWAIFMVSRPCKTSPH